MKIVVFVVTGNDRNLLNENGIVLVAGRKEGHAVVGRCGDNGADGGSFACRGVRAFLVAAVLEGASKGVGRSVGALAEAHAVVRHAGGGAARHGGGTVRSS